MTNVTDTGRPFSAFAGELLTRVQKHLIAEDGTPGHGAFGRVAQEVVELALAEIDPGLVPNPGAGIPDCWCKLSDQVCACEIKYTDNGEVHLGERDIKGMRKSGKAEGGRLIVLDIAFPARLWMLDAAHIEVGDLRPSGHGHLQLSEEAENLATHIELLLRAVDVDLIAPESVAKEGLREAGKRLWP
jgi:hypothetical protein